MSTKTANDSERAANRRWRELRLFLESAQEAHLLQPESLFGRLDALDQLDALLGDLDPEASAIDHDAAAVAQARALQSRFEAANEGVYETIRAEIRSFGASPTLQRWLTQPESSVAGRLTNLGDHRSGLRLDSRDEIVSGVLQLRADSEMESPVAAGMVHYLPTPVRHVLELIEHCSLSPDDLLVDLGSGLGLVPMLVSILTGIRTLGIEVQPGYVASARSSAAALRLTQVAFVAEDLRLAELSAGTVFYLFSPCTGSMLDELLEKLHWQSRRRPIRIGSLGPCTRVLEQQNWLRARQPPDPARITVFHSH